MGDVKWIKMMVGMFDGMSFKKIKRAKIGGESFRDKLTAVWFELLDFAGKCNHDGFLVETYDVPFTNLEEIAMMIDREPQELELCMAYFVKNSMVKIVDDAYSIANWAKYQNIDGLDGIREKARIRNQKYRENKRLREQTQQLLSNGGQRNEQNDVTVTSRDVTGNVTVTSHDALEGDTEERFKITDNKKESIAGCAAVLSLYQSICKSYPAVQRLSDARRKAIKARLNTYTLADFETVFRKAQDSDFLKGKNNRNWSATFDWLLKDANFCKVLEGNYDNKAAGAGNRTIYGCGELGEAELEAIQQALRN